MGKSQAVRQLARAIEGSTGKSVLVREARLLLFAPIDLRGIPTANADKTLAVWLKPQIFQLDESPGVVNLLFMIDTSGSVSDAMMTAAYSEVKGAIGQFGGRLRGWLGFFDAEIVEPRPFADEDDLRRIRPAGGGGTDFAPIFAYVAGHMANEPPVSIIILTDGHAPFPPQRLSGGIPVLWLLNNEDVTPPWGRVARIKV